MHDDYILNVPLLRRRVPNLTTAARSVGLRPATVSDLCNGKIPIGRAEVRTLAALASLAGCGMDELVQRAGMGSLIETGIKVVDLFAPLVRGGSAGCIARPGVGQLVLLAEVMHRLRTRRDFYTVIWSGDDSRPYPADVVPQASATSSNLEEVLSLVSAARLEHDVLVSADREYVLSGELLQLREHLHEPGSRPVTFVLYDALGETPELEGAPYGPLETLWRFDLDLAARKIYPAVDPLQSTSVLLESAQLEATHLATVARARALLRRYSELRIVVPLHGLAKFPAADQLKLRRGERLEAFLSQPFFLTEEFTKKTGTWVPLAEAIDGVKRIIDGAADDLEPDQLRYIGGLPAGVSSSARP